MAIQIIISTQIVLPDSNSRAFWLVQVRHSAPWIRLPKPPAGNAKTAGQEQKTAWMKFSPFLDKRVWKALPDDSTWRDFYGNKLICSYRLQLQNTQNDHWEEERFSCCRDKERNGISVVAERNRNRNKETEFQLLQKDLKKRKFKIAIDFKTLFSLRAAMAEDRFISTCDLASSASSFSSSSPDSTASSDDITDSGNSSWGFSPPPVMPDGCNGGPLFHMKSLRASLPSRKRGLSNFFTGKSQSFTSLADVKCVKDLAKPEKKLRSSYCCHCCESTIKSSDNNQSTRSPILLAGLSESMEIANKASFGRKMSKRSSCLKL